MSIVLLGVFFLFCPLTTSVFSSAENLPVELKVNPSTGAISELKIRGDERDMNWLVKVDGTQYAWVKENYGWGLGYFTITKGRESIKSEWKTPVNISADGMNVMYRENDNRSLYMTLVFILLSMIIIRMHNNALIPVLIRIFGKGEVLPMSMLSVWELLLPIWDWW